MKENDAVVIVAVIIAISVCFVTLQMTSCEMARYEANAKARIYSERYETFDKPIAEVTK